MELASIILAAGKGTRMNSELPKVIHQLRGKPMINHVVNLAEQIGSEKIVVVVGYKKEMVIDVLKDEDIEFAIQDEQLGTGHAVMVAENNLVGFEGLVLVLYGDVPVLSKNTLDRMLSQHISTNSVATVLSAQFENPFGYGRIIKDSEGRVKVIVEEKDATEEQKLIKEINSGIYLFDKAKLFEALKQVKSDNAQNEYYLTDVIKIFADKGDTVSSFVTSNPDEIKGVNSVEQLEELEKLN